MKRSASILLWLPLLLFVALVAVVASGLFNPSPQNRVVKSAMVGKHLPELRLPPAVTGKPGLSDAGFRSGQPRLLNIFASWCLPCIAEAPQLMRLKEAGVRIDAIAIRDTEDNLRAFLSRHGDPYTAIGDDKNSSAQLALGSAGVPETFVIDGQGRIVDQHIGDIRADDVPRILEMLRDAR